jgi:hypothetical protein
MQPFKLTVFSSSIRAWADAFREPSDSNAQSQNVVHPSLFQWRYFSNGELRGYRRSANVIVNAL